MPDQQEPIGGFPGFAALLGYFTAYAEGLRGLADGYNRAWDAATNSDAEYTFGAWARDVGKLWSRGYSLFEKLARLPMADSGPVWLPIVADEKASTAASNWVRLPAPVGFQQKVEATNLEQLGNNKGSIPASAILVELDERGESLRATIPIKGANYDKGTYVGFVRVPGGSGPPLAIIFFSYGK